MLDGRVFELLKDKSKWTQGSYARNKNGRVVCPEDAAAVCWCALGAMRKCYGSGSNDFYDAFEILSAACSKRVGGERSIFIVNDVKGYGAIMKCIKEAGI